ncbi:MAG: hypothetical protein VX359_02030 [Chloroflexota bacterium]
MKLRPYEIIEKYGRCIELISMDPFFGEITVGLFVKDSLMTVHSYSNKQNVESRLEQIRDRIVEVAGAVPVEANPHQATFDCKMENGCCTAPLRFVLKEAVMKDRKADLSQGITCKDLRSEMIIKVECQKTKEGFVYKVGGDGNNEKPEIRYRAITNGLIKYGGFLRIDHFTFTLACKRRNDKLVNILLPMARNISATEESLAAEDASGQMTTQSLGFSVN